MAYKKRNTVRVVPGKAFTDAFNGKKEEVKLHPAISHINATPEFLQTKENVEILNKLVEEVLKEEKRE